MEISLKDKVILVTGGTGTLGQTLVERLIEEEARTLFTYFGKATVAKDLETKGARGFQVNFSQKKEIDELKEKLKKETSFLDGLVNNVAIVRDKTITNLSTQDWDEVIGINLSAIFYLTKKLLPLLYRSKRAKILNIVSRVGIKGGFGQSNYAASKGALTAFTKSLAQEVGRKGICVNGINPGFFISEMSKHIPESVLEKNRQESCLNSFSDPKEVSNFIIYLLSDRVSKVTGQIFHFDSRRV